MIYELNEMIDYLDQFFESSHRVTLVGGIVGTPIEKFVLDAALKTTPFSKVLVLNGCQDYIGLMKNRLDNVLYYADIIVDEIVDSFLPIDVWKPPIYNDPTEYVKRFDTNLLSRYDIIIVFNTQLIPPNVMSSLNKTFSGKIVYVCDPLECIGTFQSANANMLYLDVGFDIPTIVDSLEKLSPIMAMARNVFGFETRSIDRKAGGNVTEISKINRRTIGRIDDCHYMSNDLDLISDVHKRQMDVPLRKNHKVIVDGVVMNDIVLRLTATTGEPLTLTDGTMLIMSNPKARPLMQLRLYNSKLVCGVDVGYSTIDELPYALRPAGTLIVRPANILSVYNLDIAKHRFNKTVLILSHPLQKTIKYSVLKNSNNVIVVDNIKKSGVETCSDIDLE